LIGPEADFFHGISRPVGLLVLAGCAAKPIAAMQGKGANPMSDSSPAPAG
jgi:hypothetical protein